MIDVCRWRACIGLWNGGHCNFTSKQLLTFSKPRKEDEALAIETLTEYSTKLKLLLVAKMMMSTVGIVFYLFLLLLLLSGDVELNPGPKGEELLRMHSADLVKAITPNLYAITDQLYAKGLIPMESKSSIYSLTGESDSRKAGKLLITLEQQLAVSPDSDQYLINTCTVLTGQEITIANSILQLLGHFVPADFQAPLTNFQQYVEIMKKQYKHQPIVATDWPPRIGKDFFGRLTLIESKDSFHQEEIAWYILRGEVDQIAMTPGCKKMCIKDIFKPCVPPSSPLRVIVDGPPGIGKTTLCRKVCNMWANGTLTHQQYDLLLYCPLRNSKIAQATTLADLCVYSSPNKVSKVVQWMTDKEGEGLLIIFDGWDELNAELRCSSLANSIICREKLAKCDVIVTSRSYASSSLLELDSVNKHVQVIGFSDYEIETVVRETLKDKNPQLTEKLINDLKIRGDVESLCYIPLVCSMVILVYCKLKGHLPTTLTELYENFILQTIRRHVKKTSSINPKEFNSLDLLPSKFDTSLQEMCQFAYLNLKNSKMTFYLYKMEQFLNESIKEKYLGLMTSFPDYDDEMYQFLHLTIQEFLAAQWIAKNMNVEEVFKKHLGDDHFRMCLRFVAGLNHLKPENNYLQYFNGQFGFQCKRRPLFGYESYRNLGFYKCSELRNHFRCSEGSHFFLLHLLYESQNPELCEILAQSICNQSLCLMHNSQSLFDIMCVSYFIMNCNIPWDYIHIAELSEKESSVFTNGLTSFPNQCKSLEVECEYSPTNVIVSMLETSLLNNIQECICEIYGEYDPSIMILKFLGLKQLKVLHLN